MLDALPWMRELDEELKNNILRFWAEKSVDTARGGFYGEIDGQLRVNERADKGLVLNARILWTFSAAYRHYKDEQYLEIAGRAYDYLIGHFLDRDHGGLYWMVDADGHPSQDKKQIYGQAFAIYALSEFYLADGRQEALDASIELYQLIERHSHDPIHRGYIEALGRDWTYTSSFSLSNKDLNEKKSMNTHLHVLEAYTNLYRAWKSPTLASSLTRLIEVTLEKIVDRATGHFRLFFDEEWNAKGSHISYGHDIEGSWLLMEAAEVLQDQTLLERVRAVAIRMAEAVLAKGVDHDGGIWNEADPDGVTDANKDWWPQAEAMVGFYNAYELTGESKFRAAAIHSWKFIQTYIVDREHGEWHWGVDPNGSPLPGGTKISAWKCPYHNGRACLEMLSRLQKETNLQEVDSL
ncbi:MULTISPECIES: AGE family epimerase/isomerase [Paenibacillus]|uniref:Cellobiose 2-epimerase n=1 Tax=Paenibacillus albilobatus TaxID=2716884 RepID=A0A919XJN1_9BACL|nr:MULTISPECIES: AGE family epimerase/isomerase [Paenibacillus]GIO32618.1 cellobiose 2-epimerase [Paenibacillus albilobatus]